MRNIEQCPICGGTACKSWPALVAPFIAEYVLHSPVSICALKECSNCGFRFFDSRFEDMEMARLYSGYRGPEYFKTRHRHEFWYSERHNEDSGKDRTVVASRKIFLLDAIKRQVDPNTLDRVLDFGGDSGQLLPEGLGRERHVFEISDAEPVSGITKLSDENNLQAHSYDLVVLSHVLEHTPDPVSLLRKVASLLKPGGWVYVEVPWERYSLRLHGRSPIYTRYLGWLSRHPRLLWVLDFYSTGFRILLNTVPPLGFPKLHEHINFFNEQSLAEGCAKAGLDVLECQRSRLPRDAHGAEVLSAMARLH